MELRSRNVYVIHVIGVFGMARTGIKKGRWGGRRKEDGNGN